jgi:hypothetical protein
MRHERLERLRKNCAELPNQDALQQLSTMYEIITDARLCGVKISDYLSGHVAHQEATHHVAGEIKCPYCPKVSPNNAGMRAHLGKSHQDKKSDWTGKY